MKNLRLSTLLIALCGSFFFTACADDDKDDGNGDGVKPTATNTITFDGKTYNFKAGIAFDYGPDALNETSPLSHYNIDFVITDGTFTLVKDSLDEYYNFSKNTSIYIEIELFSPDTVAFKAGTFSYIHDDSIKTIADVKDKYYFSYGEVGVEADGVVVDGDFIGPEYEIVGGSVVVTGTSVSNYTINYNLQLEKGKSFTGTYSGPFIYEKDY